ncbi:MAG: hypothetical protein COA33_001715 [Fluviicola sp.]|nr:hypothetical protein [Fluviicola sp.]
MRNFLKYQLITIFLIAFTFAFGQKNELVKLSSLPTELSEASGIELLNDTTFVVINDGGNTADLFVLNLDGSLRKKVRVLREKNNDWEDLAADENYLYIADFGNNKNERKNLVILKVKIASILSKKEVVAEKIYFNYQEQVSFPPKKEKLNFDAEALVCIGDSLLILTKVNNVPWTGESQLYYLPKIPGIYSIKKAGELFVGPNGWFIDAITGADYYDGKLYIITYFRKIQLNFAKNGLKKCSETKFKNFTQKEGIVVKSKNEIYIVDEKASIIGGGNIYKTKKKDAKH